MRGVIMFLAGVLFSVGLALGGMTDPAIVLAFLDVGGDWDPALPLVMFGAVPVYAVFWRVSRRLRSPLLAAEFDVPAASRVDRRLVTGAALFGVGWGLVGFCPGPALAALGAAVPGALLFTASLLAGMALVTHLRPR